MLAHSLDSVVPDLPILRTRLTFRLLESATLPVFKGAMLRGGFGYAFQRAACPQACWGRSAACTITPPCTYRSVFEPSHPPDIAHLHDLRDIPRPFVIEPPLDGRAQYAAGDPLEFGLVLIGRGIDDLPAFLFGFEQFATMGLGRQSARARLERVEALYPWQPVGEVMYQDGRVLHAAHTLPLLTGAAIREHAAALPADLHLVLQTPLRVKTRGDWLRQVEPAAITQAICWRLNALATFHGVGPYSGAYRAVVEQTRTIVVEQQQVRWVDWERTSTRESVPRKMTLGGILGRAVLRDVSPDVRAVLLMGSLVHAGKACVFGHGKYSLSAWSVAAS